MVRNISGYYDNNIDLNNFIHTGLFWINSNSGIKTNMPNSAKDHWMLKVSRYGICVLQEITSMMTNEKYIRFSTNTGSTWTACSSRCGLNIERIGHWAGPISTTTNNVLNNNLFNYRYFYVEISYLTYGIEGTCFAPNQFYSRTVGAKISNVYRQYSTRDVSDRNNVTFTVMNNTGDSNLYLNATLNLIDSSHHIQIYGIY